MTDIKYNISLPRVLVVTSRMPEGTMTVKLRPMVAAKHNCEAFRLIAKCGTINADSE